MKSLKAFKIKYFHFEIFVSLITFTPALFILYFMNSERISIHLMFIFAP